MVKVAYTVVVLAFTVWAAIEEQLIAAISPLLMTAYIWWEDRAQR